jgi:hypothetical protein
MIPLSVKPKPKTKRNIKIKEIEREKSASTRMTFGRSSLLGASTFAQMAFA